MTMLSQLLLRFRWNPRRCPYRLLLILLLLFFFSTADAVRRPWPPPLAAFASADLGFSTPSVHGYRARPPESETASPYGPSAGALDAESPKSKIT